jgi:hypothetical protein
LPLQLPVLLQLPLQLPVLRRHPERSEGPPQLSLPLKIARAPNDSAIRNQTRRTQKTLDTAATIKTEEKKARL